MFWRVILDVTARLVQALIIARLKVATAMHVRCDFIAAQSAIENALIDYTVFIPLSQHRRVIAASHAHRSRKCKLTLNYYNAAFGGLPHVTNLLLQHKQNCAARPVFSQQLR
jgi:hypothetical protein